jgi:hypothetical protein
LRNLEMPGKKYAFYFHEPLKSGKVVED